VHVLLEHALDEVAPQELLLQGVLRTLQDALECVLADLVLLHVSIDQSHAFDSIVNAMSDEIEFEDQLLAKVVAPICF